MDNILDRIVETTRQELARRKQALPEAKLRERLADAPPVRDFHAALTSDAGVSVIAEVKKASPSAGVLRDDFDPLAIADIYQTSGARAMSVLTDEPFFQGRLDYLTAIRRRATVPLLRKDFLVDAYQIVEARVAGADAVLLIAEILAADELAHLIAKTRELGMEPLVELYDRDNLKKVLDGGAKIVGVNNRNLRTFVTSLDHTLEIAPLLPAGSCLVSESGIRTPDDISRLRKAGVKAVLIGETFMRSPDMAAKVREIVTAGMA